MIATGSAGLGVDNYVQLWVARPAHKPNQEPAAHKSPTTETISQGRERIGSQTLWVSAFFISLVVLLLALLCSLFGIVSVGGYRFIT